MAISPRLFRVCSVDFQCKIDLDRWGTIHSPPVERLSDCKKRPTDWPDLSTNPPQIPIESNPTTVAAPQPLLAATVAASQPLPSFLTVAAPQPPGGGESGVPDPEVVPWGAKDPMPPWQGERREALQGRMGGGPEKYCKEIG